MDNAGKLLALKVVTATFTGLSISTVALRCYVRRKLVRMFGWDDGIMVVATLVYTVCNAAVLCLDNYNYGRHQWDMSEYDARTNYLIWWMCYVCYGTSITLARVSIGLFFLRITVRRLHRYLVMFTVGFNCLTGILYVTIVMFQCTPVPYYWNKAYPDAKGHCLPMHPYISLAITYGAVCAAVDMIFLVLPACLVWTLDMQWKTKLSLIPILGMGGLAGCCPLVRMAYLHNLGSADFLYESVDIATWSILEVGLAITASSLATLRPFFRILFTEATQYSYNNKSRSAHRLDSSHAACDRRIELTPKRLQSLEVRRAAAAAAAAARNPDLHNLDFITKGDFDDEWSPSTLVGEGQSNKTWDRTCESRLDSRAETLQGTTERITEHTDRSEWTRQSAWTGHGTEVDPERARPVVRESMHEAGGRRKRGSENSWFRMSA